MKGLLFREFYLGRKYYGLSLLIFFLVAALSILVRLSMLYGNLSLSSEESFLHIDDTAKNILTALPCIVIFITLCTDAGVVFSDFNSGWLRFCSTTPLSEKKIMEGKDER